MIKVCRRRENSKNWGFLKKTITNIDRKNRNLRKMISLHYDNGGFGFGILCIQREYDCMRAIYKRIGYISCAICGIVLSIVGFPFAVKYQSTTVPFLGEYQVHSITFLGSPIYTWSTWNGIVGPIDFFIAFILNTLTCFIIFLILSAMR